MGTDSFFMPDHHGIELILRRSSDAQTIHLLIEQRPRDLQ